MKKWLSRDLLYLYSPTSIEQRIRRQPLENFIPTSHISSYDKEFHLNRPRGRAEESSESHSSTIERHDGADSAVPSLSASADSTAHPSVPLRSLFTTRTIQRGERIAFIPFSSVLTGARAHKLLQTHHFSLTKTSNISGTPCQSGRKMACSASCSPSDALCRSALPFDGASSTDGPSSLSVLPFGTLKGNVENGRPYERNVCKPLEHDVDYLLQQLGRIEPEKTSWNTSFAELWSRDAILLTAFLFFLKKNARSVKNRSNENNNREACKGEVQRSGEKQSDAKIPFSSLCSAFLDAASSSTASPRVREIQKSDRSWSAVQRWVAQWPPVMPSFGPGLHCLESNDMTFQSPTESPATPRCPSSPSSTPSTTPSLSSSTLQVPLLSTVNGEAASTTPMERVVDSGTLSPSLHDPVQQAVEEKGRTLSPVRSTDDHAMWLAKAMQKGVHAAVEEDDALCVHEKEAKEIKTCASAAVQRTPQQLKDFFSGSRSSALTVRQHHQQVVPCATIVSTIRRKYLCRLEKETDHMLRRVWEAMKGGAVRATASSFSASLSSSDAVQKRKEERMEEEEAEADLQDLRWSHFMLRSRGVRLRPGGNGAQAGSVPHDDDDDDDGCHEGLALVPFLDMLNHSAKHYNVTYTTTATAPVSSLSFPSSRTRRCTAPNDLGIVDGGKGKRLSFPQTTASLVGNGEEEGGILVLAARTIHAGEELTMHYGNDRQRGIETRGATTLLGGQEMEGERGEAHYVGGGREAGAASRRVSPYRTSSHRSRRQHDEEKVVRPLPVSEVRREWRTREEFDTLTPPALQATSSRVSSRSGTLQPLDIRIPEGLLLRAATRWHTHKRPLEERPHGSRTPIRIPKEEEPVHHAAHVLLPGGTPKEAIGQRERGETSAMGVLSLSDEFVHHAESISHGTLSAHATGTDVSSLAAEVQEEEALLHRLCKLYQKQQISPSAVDAKVKAVQARREAEAEVEWIWRFGFSRSEEEVLLEASRRWCGGLRARIAQLTDARRHGRPGEFVLGVPEGLQHLREQRLHLERNRYHNKRIFPPQNHFTSQE